MTVVTPAAQKLTTQLLALLSNGEKKQRVAAVYFFRNPPGHNHQLHQEWGFDTEAWRRAFVQFLAGHYQAEAGRM